jgi:cyclopropane fatty-acyl-phospholipid synthase-like methyltransferase
VPGMQRFGDSLRRAQEAAFGPGEYVEQESFASASEIRELAERAAVGPGVSLLDLCCGIGGPGRFLTRELGCDYLGVDASESSVEVARERARGLSCRFEVARIPPLPWGAFDVILLLETMLAFRDKEALLTAVARALPAGGRFAFTLEEGPPLTDAERTEMPAADTVWPTPLDEMYELLARAGFTVGWQEDWSASHRAVAASLAAAYAVEGAPADLVVSHRLWSEWLAAGRVRKFALVAAKSERG